MTQETAPHIEKITRALGDKVGTEVTEAELREKLDKFLQYGVPPEQAVRSILREYGETGRPAAAGGPEDAPTKIVDLQPNVQFVNLLVRVVHVGEREISVRGQVKTIWTGIFGDDTGTVPFTAWAPFEHEKGTVLGITGAYTKEFNNEIQVNLGDRAEVKELEQDALPEYEPTVSERKIVDLVPGIGNVVVTGRILDIEKRTVLARGEEKSITTGTLADETGKVPFTAWADLALEKDQVVKIDSGYIKAYRGVPQFNFDDAATIETLAPDAVPPAAEIATTEPITIGELVEKGGGTDVTVVATLLEVRPGSGFVHRCPECNRVLQRSECRLHGTQEGLPDLRIKAVLDDGTGAVQGIVNRDKTEALLGRSLEDCQKLVEETMSWDVVEEELKAKLTGRTFEVTGNALTDDFGMMFLVRDMSADKVDVTMRAEKLAARFRELEVGA